MANRTDDFNRANNASALGTPSDAGSDWVALWGTWGISSNAGYNPSADMGAIAVLEASEADVDVQVTLAAEPSDEDFGVVGRLTDDSNFLMAHLHFGFQELFLSRMEALSENVLDSVVGTYVAGDTIKLRMDGDQISVYHNDVLVIGPITETFNETETLHGLVNYTASSGTRWDNFSITELTTQTEVFKYRKALPPPLSYTDIYTGRTVRRYPNPIEVAGVEPQIPSRKSTPPPYSFIDLYTGHSAHRLPHPIEVAAIEPKTMKYNYQRMLMGDVLPEGLTRRQAHPVTFVEIQSEEVEHLLIMSERSEIAGAIITDRYRR